MPTSKPRITITLTDQQHALLQAMAGYQGGSMSSIVVDLLETALPVMERIVLVMKAASAAPQEMLDGLKESMERAEAQVLDQMQGHMGQLDIFVKEASEAAVGLAPPAQRPTSKALPRRRAAAKPPTSNRGVRITDNSSIPPMKTSISTAKRSGVKK